jgi:hypothetical protein
MRTSLTIIATIFFLMLNKENVSAQTDPCLTYLKDASLKSDQGWYDDAIVLINKSIKECSLSKKEKIQAYKMLITNYLNIDKLEDADAIAALIMKLNPNFEPDKLRDPTEFVLLFQKYKPSPMLSIILQGGINNSKVKASKTYSIVGSDNADGLTQYSANTGFQISLLGEFRLIQNLWIKTGVQFRRSGYKNQLDSIEETTVLYEENINYFDIPLGFTYYFLKGNFQPYFNACINYSILNSALAELSRDELSDIVNRQSQRNKFYFGYQMEAGLSYAIKNFGFRVGVNYLLNPTNVNKEGTRYDNLDVVFKYYYLDNDFKMNNLQINAGVQYNLIYKNRLRKQ